MRRRRPDDTPFEETPTGMVRRGRGGGTANSRFRPTRYKRSVACVTVWLASTRGTATMAPALIVDDLWKAFGRPNQ